MSRLGRFVGGVIATCVSLHLTLIAAPAQTPAAASVPSDAEIRSILVERVDVHRQSVGIVVGVTTPSGHRIISYGTRAAGDARPLDGDTVFEIGSITKVFTSLLLADAVQRGEVRLTDPVSTLLPKAVTMPVRNGRAITLEDLARHISALPRLPTNLAPKDGLNPYADYSVEQMYQFLSSVQLTRDIGAQYEYSNLGVGLLGHVLSLRLGGDYEALVRTRILPSLGMTSTAITLSPDMRARLAQGHNASLTPVPNWDIPTLAGAGALRSTTNDMLRFLDAAIGTRPSPLAASFATMLATPRPANGAMQIGLGWHIRPVGDRRIVWHNGGTGGYRTWAGYDPDARTGVVVLTNVATPGGPDDIGFHLLNRTLPLTQTFAAPPPPPKTRTETSIAPAVFDRYAGRYQLAPAVVITVSRDGNRFLAQLTGQGVNQIYAEDERNFFYRVVDAQLTFETDTQGRATAVVLHQNGVDQRAPRIEGEPVVPKTIALDTAVLDRYVGRYQFVPGVVISIVRRDSSLFAQITGQGAAEIFAESERRFFYTVVNAQLTFETNGDGKAVAVVLHQNGRDQRADRIADSPIPALSSSP